ncbi:MAG: hypothetical protein PQJ61_02730 [Spirochaetales bacterium]|uniref:Uncharacterized protein n=1 Tax=Candidatus Thalassospirochaeta sargassi TaxID=3119039 RepID=A0AAJ1MIL9_9SPIO|nr:hypothetical protein [Spirochaetales bacterium]
MNKNKLTAACVMVFISLAAFCGGTQEAEPAAAEKIELSDSEAVELWRHSSNAFLTLYDNRNDSLSMTIELTNSKYQTLFTQNAEVSYEISDGELVRMISPVEPEDEAMGPPEAGPGEDGESRSGMQQGGGSRGGNGGPPRDRTTEGTSPQMSQPDEDSSVRMAETDFNLELAGQAASLWDQAMDFLMISSLDSVESVCTGEVSRVFSFTCMQYDLVCDDSDTAGTVWVDTATGFPIKTRIVNNAEGNLELEIFVLPGNPDDLHVSRVFYSTDFIYEDQQYLIMKGELAPRV